MSASKNRYPPIADYAVISDCHCTALVSRHGSVDWCCMPRIDADSCFGRLLDWDKGGYCSIAPTADDISATRRYVPDTTILETHFKTATGEARLTDFFAIDDDALEHPRYDHVRIVDGIAGDMELLMEVCPRFDYGEIIPHMRQDASGAYTAIGSNKGLIIHSDVALDVIERRDLAAVFRIAAGQRVRLVIEFQVPELIDLTLARGLPSAVDIDRYFETTCAWWRKWVGRMQRPFDIDQQTLRSIITLKALTFERTGAIAAASTTSLPEWIGGGRNWDYRFSWIRDSVFIVRALQELGYVNEANRFHQFIQRSCAGSAGQLQIMYGVDGKRRLTEIELGWLEGYRQSAPVRVGNAAARQMQLDIYGELMEMAWEWHASNHRTDPDYWLFLTDVVDTVCDRWREADHGIWEIRGKPAHYVHSKAMCWAAVNWGVKLAQENRLSAPLERWIKVRDAICHAVETEGYDRRRGIFVQAFNSDQLDAALLLLPRVGFVAYDDPRMLRTTDAICRELDWKGLLLRYKAPDGLRGPEGVFIPCTFWLAACLACQGLSVQAWDYYRRALGCANDIGLFSEEFDAANQIMLGNFPQGLTHVSQITARLALAKADGSAP